MPVGAWVQDPDFVVNAGIPLFGVFGGLVNSVDTNTNVSAYTVNDTAAETTAVVDAPSISSVRACCWQHAVDHEAGTQSGTTFCTAGVAKSTSSSGGDMTAGHHVVWTDAQAGVANTPSYSVAAYRATADAHAPAAAAWAAADPAVPAVPAGATIEFEAPNNTVLKVEVSPVAYILQVPHDGFTLQLRGRQTVAFPDHVSTATPALFFSTTFASGTAAGATITTGWIDVTSEFYILGGAPHLELSATSTGIQVILTPPAPSPFAINFADTWDIGSFDVTGNAKWRWTVRPPRYRINTTTIPPLRQYQRSDNLAGGPGRQAQIGGTTSLQGNSGRQSWPGSYL